MIKNIRNFIHRVQAKIERIKKRREAKRLNRAIDKALNPTSSLLNAELIVGASKRAGYHDIVNSVRAGSRKFDRVVWGSGNGTYVRSVHGEIGTKRMRGRMRFAA